MNLTKENIMSDNHFWLRWWIIVGIVAIFLAICVSYVAVNTKRLEVEMAEKGYIEKIIITPDQYNRPQTQKIWVPKEFQDKNIIENSLK